MAKDTGRVKPPKRKPGRPPSTGPKKLPIFTGLLPELVKWIDGEAAREERSRAVMIAVLLQEAAEARKKLR